MLIYPENKSCSHKIALFCWLDFPFTVNQGENFDFYSFGENVLFTALKDIVCF